MANVMVVYKQTNMTKVTINNKPHNHLIWGHKNTTLAETQMLEHINTTSAETQMLEHMVSVIY